MFAAGARATANGLRNRSNTLREIMHLESMFCRNRWEEYYTRIIYDLRVRSSALSVYIIGIYKRSINLSVSPCTLRVGIAIRFDVVSPLKMSLHRRDKGPFRYNWLADCFPRETRRKDT